MTAVTTRPRLLTNTDFATTLTASGSVPIDRERPDAFALYALANRRILVDTDAGEVYRADGITRAEHVKDKGYGGVYVGRHWGRVRIALAHRVVWLARFGPIPGHYEVAQINGLHWDNRIANLTLVTHAEATMRAQGSLTLHPPGDPDDRPTIKPYTTAHTLLIKPTRMNRRNVP